MSDINATELQDVLHDIERNAYDGIGFSEEVTRAYVFADELGESIDKLREQNAKLQASNEVIAEDHAALCEQNEKLRELARDIYSEYRYLRVRFHRIYVQHEERMRAIEQRMRELGVEVN